MINPSAHPSGDARLLRDLPKGLTFALVVIALAVCLPGRLSAQSDFAYETLILALTLNGEAKGEVFARASRPDDTSERKYFLKRADLQTLGLNAESARPIVIEGEAHIELNSLAGVQVVFDEATQTLALTVAPQRFPRQVIDLAQRRPDKVIVPRDRSAFWNYRFDYLDGSDLEHALSLNSELGARVGDFLFFSDSFHALSGDAGRSVRLNTNITYDRRDKLQRTILGDFIASSGELGGTLNLGGLSFSKARQLDPYFVQQPTPGVAAAAQQPSEVQVYMDGVRVSTERVQAGEFELKNLNYYGGARNIEVVVKDRLGRETRFAYPFYFSDLLLREGISDYSVNLGALRQRFGARGNEYGRAVTSGFYRRGMTGGVTAGLRWESTLRRGNAGPTLSARLGEGGVVSAAAAASFDEDAGASGSALAISYSYQIGALSAQASARQYSKRYAFIGVDDVAERPRSDLNASIGYGSAKLGSAALAYNESRSMPERERRAWSLSYSRSLGAGFNVLGTLTSVRGTQRGTEAFLGLTYNPGNDVNATYQHQRLLNDSRADQIQVGKLPPVGEGWGYRVAYDRVRDAAATRRSVAPLVQYNGKYGVLTGEYTSIDDDTIGSESFHEFTAAGSIGYVGGVVGFARPITDSFALVRMPGLPDVRVRQNNQEVGRTDAEGKIWLPNLGSYVDNQISVNDKDVPIDFSLPELTKFVSPGLRSGAVIQFAATRIQAFSGRLRVRIETPTSGAPRESEPAEFIEVVAQREQQPLSFATGRDGEFYLENTAAGDYAASFAWRGKRCAFSLTIPVSNEMIVELGDVLCTQLQ